MFLLTLAVPGDAAIVQYGSELRLQPSFGLVYCLVALVVALSAALVFVLSRREPPHDDDAMRCWNCNRTGHINASCPKRNVESNGPKQICSICGEHGHQKSNCPLRPSFLKKKKKFGPAVYASGQS
jgi:hypothetical protein